MEETEKDILFHIWSPVIDPKKKHNRAGITRNIDLQGRRRKAKAAKIARRKLRA